MSALHVETKWWSKWLKFIFEKQYDCFSSMKTTCNLNQICFLPLQLLPLHSYICVTIRRVKVINQEPRNSLKFVKQTLCFGLVKLENTRLLVKLYQASLSPLFWPYRLPLVVLRPEDSREDSWGGSHTDETKNRPLERKPWRKRQRL